MNITIRTYQDWLDHGYQVKRGQVAIGTNAAGYKVFTQRQVFPIYRGAQKKKTTKKK